MTILVTGVRGSIGGRVAAKLLEAGHPVRGSVRELAAPAPLPSGLDDVVELDVTTPEADLAPHAEKALGDVDAIFLYPARGAVDGFLAAAAAAGVQYVVLLSSPASYEAGESDRPIGLAHRAVEQSLERSGLRHTVLYPGWLATNARRDWFEEIRRTGRIGVYSPDAQINPIHPGDIAEVAADLLTRDTFRGRMQVLTGPESLRLREAVATLADGLDEPVGLDELTFDQAMERRAPWMPEPVLRVLLESAAASAGVPAPVNNTVERITGHPARSFHAWAQEQRAYFESA
ncbi:MAG TPA: NAD(P)H-binding protein [Actinocrinis sp.]|jgi:uncharacterized protein YbjT (DUF2867 family)